MFVHGMLKPADFTPRWLSGLEGTLSVHCPGCREVREIKLQQLVQAGRDKQPIAGMVFRCQVCRRAGVKVIEWRDASGDWRHDFSTGETRRCDGNPGFYAPPS